VEIGKIPDYVLSRKALLLQALGLGTAFLFIRFSVFSNSASGQADAEKRDRFFLALQGFLERGRIAGIFKFATACLKCGQRDTSLATLTDLPPIVPLSATHQEYFRRVLGSAASFDQSIKIAEPFVADFGFSLETREARALLLISTRTKRARLVTRDPEAIPLANIAGLFPQFSEQLELAVRTPER